jgi:hypothetical protein
MYVVFAPDGRSPGRAAKFQTLAIRIAPNERSLRRCGEHRRAAMWLSGAKPAGPRIPRPERGLCVTRSWARWLITSMRLCKPGDETRLRQGFGANPWFQIRRKRGPTTIFREVQEMLRARKRNNSSFRRITGRALRQTRWILTTDPTHISIFSYREALAQFRVTDPTCEVWTSMSEPKSGRSGASACERNEARAPTGFRGAKRG